MTDQSPPPKAPGWTCAGCGTAQLGRGIDSIELWAKGQPKPIIVQIAPGAEPLAACKICRPTALSIVRDFRTALSAVSHYRWRLAHLRWSDGTVSDAMQRAEIEAA